MSSTRAALRLTSLASSRQRLSATLRSPAHLALRRRPAEALFQTTRRHYAAKGDGEKDDLGGPGGQEPPDPTARAQQNASLRNKTALGMLLAIGIGVPFFYMVGQPGKIAEKEVDANSAGPLAGDSSNPGEKMARVQGGLPGGRKELRDQWGGGGGLGGGATR